MRNRISITIIFYEHYLAEFEGMLSFGSESHNIPKLVLQKWRVLHCNHFVRLLRCTVVKFVAMLAETNTRCVKCLVIHEKTGSRRINKNSQKLCCVV